MTVRGNSKSELKITVRDDSSTVLADRSHLRNQGRVTPVIWNGAAVISHFWELTPRTDPPKDLKSKSYGFIYGGDKRNILFLGQPRSVRVAAESSACRKLDLVAVCPVTSHLGALNPYPASTLLELWCQFSFFLGGWRVQHHKYLQKKRLVLGLAISISFRTCREAALNIHCSGSLESWELPR